MESKPFSPHDLRRLREILFAQIAASPLSRSVKSPRYLVNLYTGLVNYYYRNYIPDTRTLSVHTSYRELGDAIKEGPLCWYRGKRSCPHERRTLVKYVRLLAALNLAV